jgi:isoquinoline 1-oxidoreductase subunit beta
MNIFDMTMISRRGLLEGAAGLTFALIIPTALILRPAAAVAEGASPASIGAWVTISPDGAIVVAVPAAEMGQGSLTGLAMVFAEELDADWSRVTTTYPPVIPSVFGNPIFGGDQSKGNCVGGQQRASADGAYFHADVRARSFE